MLTKADLRETLLIRRRQVSATERDNFAKRAAKILLNSSLFQQSSHIACYYPYPTEFDCLPIIQAIWDAKKSCYLPVIPANSETLDFMFYEKDTKLTPNRYQIPEPVNQNKIAIENLDLVIVPLLGFDRSGNRLGMGAGYYDRTFATTNKKCFLLGLAYTIQEVEHVPHDPWDVKLNGALTEKNIMIL